MSTKEQIRAYLQRAHGKNVGDGDSLLDSGLIDSVGIFELVGFLEETFAIKIDDEQIVPEHFETVAQLAAFVEKTRAGTSA